MATEPEFRYSDLLPIGPDETPYRQVTTEGVSTFEADGQTFLRVAPEAIQLLTAEAMHDIAHYLRPAHLAQLRRIIDDPESSGQRPLRGAGPAQEREHLRRRRAADVPGHRHRDRDGQEVRGRADRAPTTARRSAGACTTPTPSSTCATPSSRRSRPGRRRTPAPTCRRRSSSTRRRRHGKPEYKFLFMAKGGGSANKSFLYQETKAVLNPKRMLEFLDEKIRSLGTAACPPYHLAVVIGGTSAEFALKTAKYASAHYLDNLPTSGTLDAHGFRDLELEEEVFKLTQSFGIGAQFGGKYFCHDVRVVRLPRHGASCPVAIAVSCSADRQALGKITADGVFLEQLETDPARYLPDDRARSRRTRPTSYDRPEPADGGDPRRARPAPGEDAAVPDRPARRRPRHRAREDQGAARRGRGDAVVPARPRRLLRRPGQDARGLRERAPSARPRPGGWTPTSSSSRPPAARR